MGPFDSGNPSYTVRNYLHVSASMRTDCTERCGTEECAAGGPYFRDPPKQGKQLYKFTRRANLSRREEALRLDATRERLEDLSLENSRRQRPGLAAARELHSPDAALRCRSRQYMPSRAGHQRSIRAPPARQRSVCTSW